VVDTRVSSPDIDDWLQRTEFFFLRLQCRCRGEEHWRVAGTPAKLAVNHMSREDAAAELRDLKLHWQMIQGDLEAASAAENNN
jgi:hypothetical protein